MTWRIPIAKPDLPPLEEYVEKLRSIWESRQLSNFGLYSILLETEAERRLGLPCRAVASGDVGLICAIAALELPPFSRVLVPSFTFQSTINAILWNQLVPTFVDIDPETFCVDPRDVDQVIGGVAYGGVAVSPAVHALVATSVFGVHPDVDGLRSALVRDATRGRGRRALVLDAAQAYGATGDWKERDCPDAMVYSLSGTKVVTSAEGGLVASHSEEYLRRVSRLRGYGFVGDYNALAVGINGKMSELHAALGCLTLPKVEEAVNARAVIAAQYAAHLGQFAGLAFQREPAGQRSAWKDFAVLFPYETLRTRAEDALAAAGIQTKRYFRPLHHQPAYQRWATRSLPTTTDVYHRILCLPIFGSMTTAQVEEVCDVIGKSL